jgi:hypothetical protein
VPDHLTKPARCKRFLHTPLLTAEVPGASPGAGNIPDDVKVACPPVKRIVVVRVHVGEPFSPFYSSKVEHPADNRETEERYLVEGPFLAV